MHIKHAHRVNYVGYVKNEKSLKTYIKCQNLNTNNRNVIFRCGSPTKIATAGCVHVPTFDIFIIIFILIIIFIFIKFITFHHVNDFTDRGRAECVSTVIGWNCRFTSFNDACCSSRVCDAHTVLDEAKHHLARTELGRVHHAVADDGDRTHSFRHTC